MLWRAAALLIVSGAAACLAVRPGTSDPTPAARQVEPPDPESAFAIFVAGTAARRQREDAAINLDNEIHLNGLEAGRAGLHLIRPPSDPQWSAAYGPWHPTLDYWWCSVPVHYENIEYQRRIPESVHPAPWLSWSAVVSQTRVFDNSLCVISAAQVQDESFEVRLTFEKQSIEALQALLRPKWHAVDGQQTDWYWVSHPVGAPVTPMVVGLASDNRLYLPIDVQQLIQRAGRGSATAVAASGLTQTQASDLVARYNTP